MKKILILSTFVCFSVCVQAQVFQINFDLIFRGADSSVKTLALAGGLNQPQFSNIDLNGDGIQDLFVFDRTGGKILVFIAQSDGGTNTYFYDPSFEEVFPVASQQFIQLKDFNADGLPDIWFYQINGGKKGPSVEVWKNTSSGQNISFTFHQVLQAYNFITNPPGIDTSSLAQFTGNYPAIVDLNGDGDLDYIVNTAPNETNLTYYLNNSVELGRDIEEMDFEIVDRCLGNVAEQNGDLILNAYCNFGRRYRYKKHLGARTVAFFDNDGDGDMDCFFGTSEVLSNPVYYLENGKADLGMDIDTFISIDTLYFGTEVEPQIPIVCSFHFVDINNDGVQDLIIATHEINSGDYNIRQTKNVLSFINQGSNSIPDFVFQQNDFLNGQMIDHGAHTSPVLVDMDGDEDLDLMILSNGDHFYHHDSADRIYYYENIGDKTNADFILRSEDYGDISVDSLSGARPSFVDIDNDGDQDMFIGNYNGTIYFYENDGSGNYNLVTDNYAGIDVGENAAPYFYDLDNDNVLDLLIGTYDGTIHYYRNTGTINNASFTIVDTELGGINISDTIPQILPDQHGNPVDSFVLQPGSRASFGIGKLGNEKMAIIVGGLSGVLKVYLIPEDITQIFPEVKDNLMFHNRLQQFYNKDWGARIQPAVGDLNNDGADDVLIGNSRGGLHYVKGIPDSTKYISRMKVEPFLLFPNPNTGQLTILLPTPDASFSYQITDLNGKIIQEGEANNNQTLMLNESLSNGVYFILIQVDNVYYLPQKFVLSR